MSGPERTIRATRIATIAALGVMTIVGAIGCGTEGRTSGGSASGGSESAVKSDVAQKLKAEGPIKLINSGISPQDLEANVIAGVINELGGNATVVPLSDIAAAWVQMSKTDDMVYPEMWKALYKPQFEELVDGNKTVDVAGPSALSGEEGWYVPTYVIKGDPSRGIKPSCPELPDWEALNKCAAVFKTAQTGSKGQYMSGAKAWGPYYGDGARIKNLGLDYKMEFAGSEAALQAEWKRAYEQGKPFLGLMWRPHYVTLKYDLTRVEFPPYTAKCWGTTYACNWEDIEIYNLTSGGFAEKHPLADAMVKKFDLSNEQARTMMEMVNNDGMTPEAAAAKWIEDNQKVWQAWAPTAAS
jgi:glycine betaine/proline transport system substrate-binding protein